MSGKRSGVVRDANAGLSVPTCATTADKAWLRQVHTVLNRLAANTAARKETDARTLNSLYALGVAGKNAPWAADGDPAKARLASFSSLVSVPVRGPPTKGRSKKNAVLQTVDVVWPHAVVPGWECTAEKIALTGMFYHPTNVDESDYALCQYCQLGLAGWEANDNPVFEHQKRSPDCIMFKGPAALEHLSASSKEYLRNLMAAEAAPIDATELDPVPLDQPSKPAMEGMVIDTQEEDATLRNENTVRDSETARSKRDSATKSVSLETGAIEFEKSHRPVARKPAPRAKRGVATAAKTVSFDLDLPVALPETVAEAPVSKRTGPTRSTAVESRTKAPSAGRRTAASRSKVTPIESEEKVDGTESGKPAPYTFVETSSILSAPTLTIEIYPTSITSESSKVLGKVNQPIPDAISVESNLPEASDSTAPSVPAELNFSLTSASDLNIMAAASRSSAGTAIRFASASIVAPAQPEVEVADASMKPLKSKRGRAVSKNDDDVLSAPAKATKRVRAPPKSKAVLNAAPAAEKAVLGVSLPTRATRGVTAKKGQLKKAGFPAPEKPDFPVSTSLQDLAVAPSSVSVKTVTVGPKPEPKPMANAGSNTKTDYMKLMMELDIELQNHVSESEEEPALAVADADSKGIATDEHDNSDIFDCYSETEDREKPLPVVAVTLAAAVVDPQSQTTPRVVNGTVKGIAIPAEDEDQTFGESIVQYSRPEGFAVLVNQLTSLLPLNPVTMLNHLSEDERKMSCEEFLRRVIMAAEIERVKMGAEAMIDLLKRESQRAHEVIEGMNI